MESRRGHEFKGTTGIRAKSAPLPVDYLKLIQEVFSTNFDEGLKALKKMKPSMQFEANGAIFADEIVLSISLTQEEELAATTAYASMDFDPKASVPTVQDLLSACVDALGSVFTVILNPENPERMKQVAAASLSAFEGIPFEWAPIAVEQNKVFVKVDKANPRLDQLADDWLAKNDPDMANVVEQEEEDTKKLFVTGPKKPDVH